MALLLTTALIPCISAETMKIYPSDDVFVRDRAPTTNFNSINWERELRVGYASTFGIDKSFLKFNLSSFKGKNITAAFLILECEMNQENPVIEFRSVSNNSWSEKTLTWATAPSVGSLINSINNPPLEKIKINVSAYLSGNYVSFAIVENGGSGFSKFSSKESGMNSTDDYRWPYLEVTYSGGSCNTAADLDCNGKVSRSELGIYITKWTSGQITRSQLSQAIVAWMNG